MKRLTKLTKLWRSRPLMVPSLFWVLGILSADFFFSPWQKPIHPDLLEKINDNKSYVYQGVIIERHELPAARTRFDITLHGIRPEEKWQEIQGKIRLSLDGGSSIQKGDRVLFQTRLKQTHSFKNTGDFDYKKYLSRKSIQATGYLSKPDKILKIGKDRFSVGRIFDKAREEIQINLNRLENKDGAVFLSALLIGKRGGIKNEWSELFQRLGLSHLLAISGLHVGMVSSVFFASLLFLLTRSQFVMLRLPVRRCAALFSIFPILFYICLAGGTPSSTRAGLMIGLYLLALALDRDLDLWNTLAGACLLLLAWDPTLLFEKSFQLSFLAMIGLLFVITQERFKASSYLIRYIAIAGCILLMTAPMASGFSQMFSAAGLFCNLWAIPWVGFAILPIAFLGGLLTLVFPEIGFILFQVAAGSVAYFYKLLLFLDPYLSYLAWPLSLTNIEMVFFYGFIILLGFSFHYRRILYAAALCLAMFLAIFMYPLVGRQFSHDLKVHFLDVGQGDATLIEFPRGELWLIDAGGYLIPPKQGEKESFNTGERVVLPYLLRKKILHLDKIILTHPHPDHYGGIEPILKTISVGEVWLPRSKNSHHTYQSLLNTIQRKRIAVKSFDDLFHMNVGGVDVEYLYPIGPVASRNLNESSQVLRLQYHKISILITGDIERIGEETLVQMGSKLKSTILKAPHHGSATSSSEAFIRLVQPELAVISCGFKNNFHFPRPEVLERYNEFGSRVLRTDLDGEIIVHTSGNDFHIH